MEAEQLIEVIKAAFPCAPLPEMSLHQAQLADQSMSREISEKVWRAAGEADAGRSWQDYGDGELMACDAALAHLDEEAFVYYLPANEVRTLLRATRKGEPPASVADR